MTDPLRCTAAAPAVPGAGRLPSVPGGAPFDAVIADVDDTLTLDNSTTRQPNCSPPRACP